MKNCLYFDVIYSQDQFSSKKKLRRASHNEIISPFKAKKIVARRVTFSVNLMEEMQSSNNGIYRQKLFLS